MATDRASGGPSTVPPQNIPGDRAQSDRSRDHTSGRRDIVRRSGRPMATDVSVQIAVASWQRAEAEAAADACMAWFDEVDQRLSRFRPESELSRLNAAAGEWFAASDVLFACAALAVASAQASGGLFDPTMLGRLRSLGYDRDFAAIAQREITSDAQAMGSAQTPAERAAWRDIELDPHQQRIRLPAGVEMDFGGIAKGWSADVALARYCLAFPGALINVGGDLRAQGGPQPGQLWSVGIRDPRLELTGEDDPATHLATVLLSRGAMATSGAVRRWWLRDGQRLHHLLDPRTGRPAPLWIDERDGDAQGSLIATATAFAPTAARAEVAAKMALLRGYPIALSAVETAWERYAALGPEDDADVGIALALVLGNGEVTCSKHIAEYLATWGTDGAALPMLIHSALPALSLEDIRRLERSS